MSDAAAVKAIFKNADTSGDGLISMEEMKAVFMAMDNWSDEEVAELFAAADTSGDGQLQYEEFVDWVMFPDGTSVIDGSSITQAPVAAEAPAVAKAPAVAEAPAVAKAKASPSALQLEQVRREANSSLLTGVKDGSLGSVLEAKGVKFAVRATNVLQSVVRRLRWSHSLALFAQPR